jgi:hypothetical protein
MEIIYKLHPTNLHTFKKEYINLTKINFINIKQNKNIFFFKENILKHTIY